VRGTARRRRPAGAVAAAGTPLPWALRLAAALTALVGLALVAYAVVLLVLVAVRPRGTALGVAVLGGVLFAAFGAGLVLAGRSIWRGGRRGRAPALVAHLVLLLLVPGLIAGGTWWLGVPLALVTVTAGVGLLLPSSVRALTPRAPRGPGR